MKMKIDNVDLNQVASRYTGYRQELFVGRGDKHKYYDGHTPARFARFMSIVLAFAARHDTERNHANS